MDSIQTVMDQNEIDCKLKLQPLRNIARLASSQSFKVKGSCRDKEGTKISASLKIQAKEKTTLIKNLTLKFENIEIPRQD